MTLKVYALSDGASPKVNIFNADGECVHETIVRREKNVVRIMTHADAPYRVALVNFPEPSKVDGADARFDGTDLILLPHDDEIVVRF